MGTMPAVRRMTSAQPDRCSPRYSLVGVHDARTSTNRDEPRSSSPPNVSLISRVTVPVMSWKPAPAPSRQSTIQPHTPSASIGSIAISASTWVRIWHTMRNVPFQPICSTGSCSTIMRPVDRGCPAGSSSIVLIASAAVNGAKRRGGDTSSRRMCGRWSACRRDSRARTNSSGTAFSFTFQIVKVSSLLEGQTRR